MTTSTSPVTSTTTWQNWGRTVRVQPVRMVSPGSVDEVCAVVRSAAADGLGVKVVGAGHSFSPIAEAEGVLLSLDRLSGLIRMDRETRTVTFGAGTRLHEVSALLEPLGLGMENLGDIDTQSLAGAISTGTHGTGLRFRGLAAQVTGAVLVTGHGELLRIDADHRPELLSAVALGLGALGILVEVTIACVDAFDLRAVEKPEPLDAVLESLHERASAVDHFEFFWFPHTRTALTKVNTRVPVGEGRTPLTRGRRWFDDTLMANGMFRMTCGIGRAVPASVPWLNRAAERLTGDRSHSDASSKVFATRRTVRFREMEYAIPADQAAEALREVRDLIERERWRISFPVEVRFAAADELWLSTASGRETAYIAVHRVIGEDVGPYFRAVEDIMRARGGRPHWGKMHTREASDLSGQYPKLAEFRTLREELDPEGSFLNPYLRRVLG
ncbi:FAD-binding protein [Arthrobacter echini]|uniref:FAD-binding protein n=1 Tax=Arthrobacter echini TaxID=1529066 RepID=A0A4S5E0R4_9MICC|nr:D-arabinono-1,4-lactone oxidase [Arthrobacter echini]THJ64852.1 FAD-binding protein [Arthrobacter echini]